MNLRKAPSFTFERSDGTRQNFDYDRARRDDLHLTPISFELFRKLEALPVFRTEMTALWTSETEQLPQIRGLIDDADHPEEIAKSQKFALFPLMLRLQALRDLRAHPSVQRFAASRPYRYLLEDPRLRHEFLSRHPLRNLEEAPYLCGWYPEELMEFIERTHRWGTHEIIALGGFSGPLFCQQAHCVLQDYLPMHVLDGERMFRLSGLPQHPGQDNTLTLNFIWFFQGKRMEWLCKPRGSAGERVWVLSLPEALDYEA